MGFKNKQKRQLERFGFQPGHIPHNKGVRTEKGSISPKIPTKYVRLGPTEDIKHDHSSAAGGTVMVLRPRGGDTKR